MVRHGIPAFVAHSWTIPDRWELPHRLDVGVALLDDDTVTPHLGRLTFWPFTHEGLHDDLRACGLTPQMSTYSPTVERYVVTATVA